MQIDIRQAIYLAALLHDIGKFWQRASNRDETLSVSTKNIEADLCPKYNERYSHKHVLWTSEFFEKFSSILPQEVEFEKKRIPIGHLSARHHKRDLKGPELIISFADKLSSGHDRREKEEKAIAEKEFRDYEKFKKTRLQNVFDNLFRGVQETYYLMTPLMLDDSVFAFKTKDKDDAAISEYKTLWNTFEKQMEKLPGDNFDALAASLLSLLKIYTWCIPSSTMEQPDVSLFDHLKTTAAIAVSLYDSQKDHGNLPETIDGVKEDKKNRFTLIGGDFSGIQNFIYQISSKAAAKTLKGRSYYLQLIVDVVLEKIKSLYNVQDSHVLFASGGRFYMLLPNTEEKWKETLRVVDDVNIKLLEQYDGKLYLALGRKDFSAATFFEERGYPKLVEELQKSIEKEKSHRYSRIIGKEFSFFEPDDLKGLTSDDVCKITGMDLYPDEELIPEEKKNRAPKEAISLIEGEGSVSMVAYEQIRLGTRLRNARWMVRYQRKKDKKNKDEFEPLGLGYTYRFYDKEELNKEHLRDADGVIAINETIDFLRGNQGIGSIGCTFQFYGAAWTPKNNNGDVLEFADIAEDGQVNALGIIRMDVDNLGKAFKEGFIRKKDGKEESIASISRVTTFSSQLDWFFSGYMNHLLSGGFNPKDDGLVLKPDQPDNNHPYGRHLYPVYAGGDDVFVVTRWDLAPVLARKIRDDFKRFTNDNPTLNISGGISVIHPKSPIHKGAVDAGRAEDSAKKLKPVNEKNALTWLGVPLGWDDHILAAEMAKDFRILVEKMDSRAVIGLLRDISSDFLRLKDLFEQRKSTQDPLYGRWRWRAAYQLTRMKKAYKEFEELTENGVGGEVFLTGTYNGKKPQRPEETEIVEILPLVTRWLTLLTRTTRKN